MNELTREVATALAVIGSWAFVGAMTACPPPQPPVVPPDAADAGPYVIEAGPDGTTSAEAKACAALDRAGCVTLPDCETVLVKVQSDPHFVHYDLTCVAHALTPSDVAACGLTCTPKATR